MKRNSSTNSKDTSKNGNPDHIAAQTFSFRELATATRNFRADCLLGEGGFGRVYKGRLESINQVSLFSHYLFVCLLVYENGGEMQGYEIILSFLLSVIIISPFSTLISSNS